MVMLGFPQQWLVDAYTIKPPSLKLDSALWWGKGQRSGLPWFLGVLTFKDTPTLPVFWRRNHPMPVSLWSGLAGTQSLVTGYHGQRPACQASALGLNS